jgi:amphi-Trp domain-containing protein
MVEEVLFETERRESTTDIAATLRMVADKLDAGESITLNAGEQSITLDVPAQPTFEVKAEREGTGPGAELSVEFELEWNVNEDGSDASLSVE